MIISQIRSDGQIGVDIAALRAAKKAGVPTGGYMPKGWLTLAGPRPEYAQEYGLVELLSPQGRGVYAHGSAYPPRTFANVAAAQVTVRIAVYFRSLGERCTAAACARFKKPPVDIRIRRSGHGYVVDTSEITDAVDAIRLVAAQYGQPIIVNFAGNSEQTAPGIEVFAETLVTELITRLRQS